MVALENLAPSENLAAPDPLRIQLLKSRNLQNFRTIKIKPEKNPYTQANTCLVHISRNLKNIFKYMCFTLYL